MRKLMMVMVVMVVAAAAQEHRPVNESPAWKSLQTLVGEWKGTVNEGG